MCKDGLWVLFSPKESSRHKEISRQFRKFLLESLDAWWTRRGHAYVSVLWDLWSVGNVWRCLFFGSDPGTRRFESAVDTSCPMPEVEQCLGRWRTPSRGYAHKDQCFVETAFYEKYSIEILNLYLNHDGFLKFKLYEELYATIFNTFDGWDISYNVCITQLLYSCLFSLFSEGNGCLISSGFSLSLILYFEYGQFNFLNCFCIDTLIFQTNYHLLLVLTFVATYGVNKPFIRHLGRQTNIKKIMINNHLARNNLKCEKINVSNSSTCNVY